MVDIVSVIDRIVESICGVEIPKGDPAGCYAAAYRMGQLAQYVGDIKQKVAQGAADVSGANTGRTVSAFHGAADEAGQHMSALLTTIDNLSNALDQYAALVERTQKAVREQIEAVAASIAVGVLFGFLSDGLADFLTAPRVMAAFAGITTELTVFQTMVGSLIAKLMTYSMNAAEWGIADQASKAGIAALNGEPIPGVEQLEAGATQAGDARISYDVTNDGMAGALNAARESAAELPGPLGRIARALPEGPSVLATRAVSRMTASALVYTPVLNSEQGKADLQPTSAELRQKALTNMVGRVWVDQIRRGRR